MRVSLDVADIFRAAGPAYRAAHAGHLNRVQLKVMTAIENCRTAALGGHVEACEDCGHWRIAYNSCRNRHCPKCQGAAARTWLAERDGRAIGYAQAGRCGLPHAEVRPEDGEVKRLYLRGDAQNGGAGRALMDAMLTWLLADGPRTLWLSVWSENYGAQRFYARYGFEFAGEYEFLVGAQRDREFMYRRVA